MLFIQCPNELCKYHKALIEPMPPNKNGEVEYDAIRCPKCGYTEFYVKHKVYDPQPGTLLKRIKKEG